STNTGSIRSWTTSTWWTGGPSSRDTGLCGTSGRRTRGAWASFRAACEANERSRLQAGYLLPLRRVHMSGRQSLAALANGACLQPGGAGRGARTPILRRVVALCKSDSREPQVPEPPTGDCGSRHVRWVHPAGDQRERQLPVKLPITVAGCGRLV